MEYQTNLRATDASRTKARHTREQKVGCTIYANASESGDSYIVSCRLEQPEAPAPLSLWG
jgi:hypothetical protein